MRKCLCVCERKWSRVMVTKLLISSCSQLFDGDCEPPDIDAASKKNKTKQKKTVALAVGWVLRLIHLHALTKSPSCIKSKSYSHRCSWATKLRREKNKSVTWLTRSCNQTGRPLVCADVRTASCKALLLFFGKQSAYVPAAFDKPTWDHVKINIMKLTNDNDTLNWQTNLFRLWLVRVTKSGGKMLHCCDLIDVGMMAPHMRHTRTQ